MKIQVFQAGNVPGASVQQAAAAVGFTPGLRQDSLVYPQELTQVVSKSRELYRPRKWRRYLDTEPVASWAAQIEDRRYRTFVEDPVNLTNKAPTQELPLPSFETSNQYLPIYEFGTAYAYTDRDIELAQHLGIPLAYENIQAANLSVEDFLERVASVGHTANGVTLKGLCNLPDIGTATASVKDGASDTKWTYANTTADKIVADLHAICNAVETNSKETDECTQILLPLAQYRRAREVRTTSLERSALDVFLQERAGVQVSVWDKLKDQGQSVTPCAIGYSRASAFAPRMLMQRELTFGTPLRGTNGWLVPGKLAIGGMRCLAPTHVIKMSGL